MSSTMIKNGIKPASLDNVSINEVLDKLLSGELEKLLTPADSLMIDVQKTKGFETFHYNSAVTL